MYKIATIAGSLRKDSFNKKLMHAVNKLNHPELEFRILKLDEIPLFNQDNENNLPASVANFKNEIVNSDGVLFVTPEYNRSIPGVLKNTIDWGTRPPGTNVWKNKPFAAIGISPGNIGTAIAQSHLRSVMVSIGAIFMGLPEVYMVYKDGLIDENFNITDENTKKFLQGFVDSFTNWIRNYSSA